MLALYADLSRRCNVDQTMHLLGTGAWFPVNVKLEIFAGVSQFSRAMTSTGQYFSFWKFKLKQMCLPALVEVLAHMFVIERSKGLERLWVVFLYLSLGFLCLI